MNRITSVPAVVMNMQPDRHGNPQPKAELNATNDNGVSFLKCFESYLQEAAASTTENVSQSQVADALNWQYMLMMLPRGLKVRHAAGEN